MNPEKIIIAIDGYSSCGKSTISRDLAKKLGYRYIDTGAMYRAVTYYLIKNKIDIEDHHAVSDALTHIHIDFDYDDAGKQITILNGENLEKYIRMADIVDNVSQVSTIKEVRHFLVSQQQKMGESKGIVMDGRDIGTVVFPNAELKIFMTANEDIRIQRRFAELETLGIKMSLEEVRENIRKRDYTDTHREESPLRQAEDAIVIDNTNLSREQQLEKAYRLAVSRL